MGTFKSKIDGLDKVIARIASVNQALATKVDEEIGQAAQNIASAAKSNAPKDKGDLIASIGVDANGHNSRLVGTDLLYGAYVEFGTGEKVFQGPFTFSSEQKTFAKEFYVTGEGRIKSQPYLFPALAAETPKVLSRIRKVLFKDL